MKFLVVDDHVLIREALRGVLREIEEQATILEAANSLQAMRLVELHPDLAFILLDIGLPDRDGFTVLTELRQRYPAISVVILSGNNDRNSVMKALDLGALGFIPKSGQREVMLNALRLVFSGGIYIPPEILARPGGSGLSEAPAPAPAPSRASPSPADLGLTARQLEVLALIMRGKSNKAICRALSLAEPTVKNHVTAILKSLKANNRTEAVIAANALGWVMPPVEG
jgi:DNA-binding NarL/FixJ family response regulator